MTASSSSYSEGISLPEIGLMVLIAAAVIAILGALAAPLAIQIDTSTSHGHGSTEEIREKCTGSPYWFNPVTRYAARWCRLENGQIGYQILRWVQKGEFWKEVTTFDDKVKAGYTLEATIEEYLVNSGYVNIEWLAGP